VSFKLSSGRNIAFFRVLFPVKRKETDVCCSCCYRHQCYCFYCLSIICVCLCCTLALFICKFTNWENLSKFIHNGAVQKIIYTSAEKTVGFFTLRFKMHQNNFLYSGWINAFSPQGVTFDHASIFDVLGAL